MKTIKTIYTKPFLKWVGGKRQLLPEIDKLLALLPLNTFHYIEPFIGGGAVLFHLLDKDIIQKATINDKNKDLATAYQVIQNQLDTLIEVLGKLSTAYFSNETEEAKKDFFYIQRQLFNQKNHTPVDNTALLLFLNRTCFNGLYRVNRKGGFNVPFGRYKNPKILNEINLRKVHQALQSVTILSDDYAEILTKVKKNTVVYLDPPYKPISKTASFTAYGKDNFNDVEQERLKIFCDAIHQKEAYFILSNSDLKNTDPNNNYFDDLYKDYNIKRVPAKRNINSDGTKRGAINELLITNF